MTTTIERFTQWARENPQRQYTALMGLLASPVELLACFDEQPGNKARGIDQVCKADYEVDVSGNARQIRNYAYLISRVLFKWINRRSQRRSCNWAKFSKVLRAWMPPLRIRNTLYPKPLWMT